MCGPNAVLLNLNICVAFEEIVDVVLLSGVLRCCAVIINYYRNWSENTVLEFVSYLISGFNLWAAVGF